ncbi:hypothetical protein D3C75_978690 [compost metagenome]
MHKDIDRRADLLPDYGYREISCAKHHRLQAADHIPRAVRVPCGQASRMAGVHRLQHIQAFGSPDLTDHDTVRPHPQGRADQITDCDLPASLRVSVPRLQGDEVRHGDNLQLGRVLDRNDPFLRRNELGQSVQKCSLAGAGTAADKNVVSGSNQNLQKLRRLSA